MEKVLEFIGKGAYRQACELGMSSLITLERELGADHPVVVELTLRQLHCAS